MRQTLLAILLLCVVAPALAETPRLINYQGVLTDEQGQPLSGDHAIVLSIYADATTTTALWTETHSAVAVTDGLFNVILGGTTPLNDDLFNSAERWIGVKVGDNLEISPRSQLTAVPWALRAAATDGASGDNLWETNGADVFRTSGTVGVGTASPEMSVHIVGSSTSNQILLERIGTSAGRMAIGADANGFRVASLNPSQPRLYVTQDGNLGIGTSAPNGMFSLSRDNQQLNTLANQKLTGAWPPVAELRTYTIQSSGSSAGRLCFATGNNERMRIDVNGNIGIGTSMPEAKLDVAGTTRTQILEITGADLVESFDTRDRECSAGDIVVIDQQSPGQLKLSHDAYDTKVAGVVSGAGGVSAGIHLGKGSTLDGNTPVAMTGRVYVKCTTENGAIAPGDLLTTSSVPGHAMKATDQSRAWGAVIGKAMSSLEEGQGLVLVLIQPH